MKPTKKSKKAIEKAQAEFLASLKAWASYHPGAKKHLRTLRLTQGVRDAAKAYTAAVLLADSDRAEVVYR